MLKNLKIKYVFISLVISMLLFSGGLRALELDVEEGLQDFISSYRLPDLELQGLSDPFADFRQEAPEINETEEPDEPGEDIERKISPPNFVVTGLVTRGREMVVVIETEDKVKILQPGQSYNGYIFSHKISNRVVFNKEGENFELFADELRK